MKNYILMVSAGALRVFTTPAFATANLVNCIGYVIGLSDDVLIEGQARAGSVAAFEQRVCESSKDRAGEITEVTLYPVFIEELQMSTRVIVIPTNTNDN